MIKIKCIFLVLISSATNVFANDFTVNQEVLERFEDEEYETYMISDYLNHVPYHEIIRDKWIPTMSIYSARGENEADKVRDIMLQIKPDKITEIMYIWQKKYEVHFADPDLGLHQAFDRVLSFFTDPRNLVSGRDRKILQLSSIIEAFKQTDMKYDWFNRLPADVLAYLWSTSYPGRDESIIFYIVEYDNQGLGASASPEHVAHVFNSNELDQERKIKIFQSRLKFYDEWKLGPPTYSYTDDEMLEAWGDFFFRVFSARDEDDFILTDEFVTNLLKTAQPIVIKDVFLPKEKTINQIVGDQRIIRRWTNLLFSGEGLSDSAVIKLLRAGTGETGLFHLALKSAIIDYPIDGAKDKMFRLFLHDDVPMERLIETFKSRLNWSIRDASKILVMLRDNEASNALFLEIYESLLAGDRGKEIEAGIHRLDLCKKYN